MTKYTTERTEQVVALLKAKCKELYNNSPHDDEWDCPFEELEYAVIETIVDMLQGESLATLDDIETDEYYYHPRVADNNEEIDEESD